LIDLIDSLTRSEVDAKRTVQVTKVTPNELRVPNYRRRADSFLKLVVELKASDSSTWTFEREGEKVGLKAGRLTLAQLRVGLEDVQNGVGDYRIGPRGHEL
jgi:hypothetical protein